VTGSSIRRTDAETALPVTVLRVEELRKLGITTAEQAVQRLTNNQSSFATSNAIGGTTGGKAEVDLRGLSSPTGNNANKTLVLLNGRRVANHAFDAAATDLNTIPFGAIDRIEVLRDGASAIYGTDAIGGVVNFILRRDYQGVEASAERQFVQKNGGDTNVANIVAGFGSLAKDRFNVMGSVNYRSQEVLEAKDRSFSNTGVFRGAINAGTSGSSFPGDVGGFEPSLAAGCNPPSSIRNAAGTACRYDFARDVDLIPENEQLTALARGSFALTPNWTVSAEYFWARNEIEAKVAPSPISHFIPATSPFFPAGATVINVPTFGSGGVVNWRQVPAGKRTSGNETTTDRGLLELQGSLSDWEIRTAVGRSTNKTDEQVKNGYLRDDIVQAGIIAGAVNPFGPQSAAGSAVLNRAQVREAVATGKNEVDFVDARATKDIMQLAAGPLSLAIGGEYRREKSSFENFAVTGELGSLGLDPDADTSGSRNIYALFAELAIPIIKNLDVSVAARYDKYSDFGSTFNPKVGVRYQPIKEMLFRGSYNKGFRAPTLYDIYQPRSLTFTSDSYNDPLLCPNGNAVPGASAGVVCDQQVLQRQSGPVSIGRPVDALSPEKSNTYSLGFVFAPIASTSVSVDYWNIKVESQISALPEQAVFGNPAKYSSRFVRCSQLDAAGRSNSDVCLNFPGFDPIAYIDVPTENLGDLKTSGLDLGATWRGAPTDYGQLSLAFDGTYVAKFEYQRESGGEFIDANGNYADNAPVIRWKHVLTAGWNVGPFSTLLSQRFNSGYTDQNGVSGVSPYTLYDLSVTWTGVRSLALTFAVKNLFDKDPPASGQVTTFQRGFDPRFTDPLGRNFVVRASYKFF
jgi:iron complex outermembrane receptor protein